MRSYLLCLWALAPLVAAEKKFSLPKSWAEIGYDKFKDPPANRNRAPWLSDPAKVVPKKKAKDEQPPSAINKAIVGVTAAVAVATMGGSVLGGEPRPDFALAQALKRPVVVIKKDPTEGGSIPNEVFTLVKAIVGVGVLSLPAGVAAFVS